MQLYFALYRSRARRHLTESTVRSIILASVRNNRRDGLTGFLHTDQDHFLQYIEGPQDMVMKTMARIQTDRRHYNLIVLADGSLDERMFPDWNMGQITELQAQENGLWTNTAWLRPDPHIDPLPLIAAFASYALGDGAVEIDAEE